MDIRGGKERCPLCRNPLSLDQGQTEKIFPVIGPSYNRSLARQIMLFISVVAIVISFTIYRIFPARVNWPIFVFLGILSMWLSLILMVRKRHNITKTIMWQVTIVSLLAVIWDWRTGWRGWSLDYIIPIACVSAMLLMYVTAKVLKLSVRDYLVYFFLDALFGLIPILFILFKWSKVFYPSVICVAMSIIFLAAILIFQGENIKAELAKKMHQV